jgi:hypothetical protein
MFVVTEMFVIPDITELTGVCVCVCVVVCVCVCVCVFPLFFLGPVRWLGFALCLELASCWLRASWLGLPVLVPVLL